MQATHKNQQHKTAKALSTKKILWSISGSDCSGGAGIAADIKTGHNLGVEVCTLITANTVQNSNKLVSVNPVDISLLQQQVEVLITDKPPAVIKIGLLVSQSQITWLCQTLVKLKQQQPNLIVIFDPVGQASVGGNFSSITAVQLKKLLPLLDIITPNLIEAKQLAQTASADPRLLASTIQKLGVNSVIIKGGHAEINTSISNNMMTDYCVENIIIKNSSAQTAQTLSYQLSSPYIQTNYSHGGGCTFATALASFIAQGYLLRDAFTLTKAFINQGLKANQALNTHQTLNPVSSNYYGAFEQLGFPKNADDFPRIVDQINKKHALLPAFKSLGIKRSNESKNTKLGLYPVVNSIEWLKRLLPLNLAIIQLRLKNHSEEELAQLIIEAIALSKNYNTRLFINDYWQLAIKHGAYGVHIGQEDIQQADLLAIQQTGLRLGISTHGCYEFLLAQQLKPSYLAIGAIFPTKTKDMTGQIQGLDNLAHLINLATDIPIVAIGGINLERAPAVWQTGVDSLAVVTAITEAESPEKAVKQFQQLMLT